MTCAYCQHYADAGLSCEICAIQPQKRNKTTRKASIATKRVKTPRIVTRAPKTAIPDDNDELVAWVKDGRLHAALGFGSEGKQYLEVVDRLIAQGYDVEKYRYRIVSGLNE